MKPEQEDSIGAPEPSDEVVPEVILSSTADSRFVQQLPRQLGCCPKN
jgi:hypothetical protein